MSRVSQLVESQAALFNTPKRSMRRQQGWMRNRNAMTPREMAMDSKKKQQLAIFGE